VLESRQPAALTTKITKRHEAHEEEVILFYFVFVTFVLFVIFVVPCKVMGMVMGNLSVA
jgi:hypothetical protein